MRALLPQEDIVYYADQAHVPYGDRSPAELERLLAHNVAYLEGCGVDAIVMGCNTSCAIAASRGWPRCNVPILDLIAAAAAEVARSGARRVGVIGTLATVRSGAYGAAIRHRDSTIAVQEVAAPALVPLVESGRHIGPLARDAVAEACVALRGPLDALVLACTHYPLLDSHFAAVLGDVVRIDPAQAQARRAAALVKRRPDAAFAQQRRGEGGGRTRYVTTGELAPYRRGVDSILEPAAEHVAFATAPALKLHSADAAALPCP